MYASRSLRGAERRYIITELEGLALVWCLRKWRIILMGRRIRVKTDHRALKFGMRRGKPTDDKMASLLAGVRSGTFTMFQTRRIPWRTHCRASQFVNENKQIVANVGNNVELTPTRVRRSQVAKATRITTTNGTTRVENDTLRVCLMAEPDEGEQIRDWINLIRDAQIRDANDQQMKYLTTEYPDRYTLRDKFIRTIKDDGSDRVTIPNVIAWELVDRIHRCLIHFGTDKVLEFTRRYFDIENLERIARDVVASCNLCMATKVYSRPTRGPEYYDLPRDIRQVTSIDLYGPLPRSYDGNVYVLVAMDQFSKFTMMYSMRNQKLKTIEKVLEEFYFQYIGRVPRTILSDCGGQFVASRWKAFAGRVGFKVRKTSPYNPQSNPVERVMRELGRALRAYACNDHRHWDKVVPRIEQVINATEHSSTAVAPAVLEDREIDLIIGPPEILRPRENLPKDRDRLIQQANERLRLTARKRRRQSEKHGTAIQYKIVDLVWIKSHRRSDQRHAKIRKLFRYMKDRFVCVPKLTRTRTASNALRWKH